MFRGGGKKNKTGHVIQGKQFMMCHCFKELENEEKWKNCDVLVVPHKAMKETMEAQLVDDDEALSDDGKRSPTPNSVAKTVRPIGRKQAKEIKKKGGDDELTKAVVDIADARKEASVARKMDMEKESVTEARKATFEERKLALEEKKVAMQESQRLMEEEKKMMLMDTSNFDARQKEYTLCRDHILAKKRMLVNGMNGYGGNGAPPNDYGGMGGMGAPPGGMGGMGASPNAYGGYGASPSAYGGMGAPTSGYGVMGATSSGHGGMGEMSVSPGGFMATMMANMAPMNDGFGDSTHVQVSNEDEAKYGECEDEEDDEEKEVDKENVDDEA